MSKRPASDSISGTIIRVEKKVKHGVPRLHRVLTSTEAAKSQLSPENQEIMTGTVNSLERDKINKEVREKADNPVANTMKKISKEVRDLANFN